MMQFALDDQLVSIVMPAFRVEAIIQETINSVVSQTHTDWELLIADDCSPDGTARIVEDASRLDGRVKLIRCAKNGGPAAARNAALRLARGRWVAFLDSDDLWLPGKLEESLTYASRQRAALTYTGYRRMTFDGGRVGRYVSVPRTMNYYQLLGNTAIATSTVLVDRLAVGSITMRSTYYDDFVCWLEILKRGHLAHGLDKDLMRYRVVENSVSRNKGRSAAEVWKTYRQVEKLGRLRSFWYFSKYSLRAMNKYRRF